MNQETQRVMFSSAKSDWETPHPFFQKWDEKYHFTLDAGASASNHLCHDYLGLDNGRDALKCEWGAKGARVWSNPPYARKVTGEWIKKGYEESLKGKIVVMLLPGRIDTAFFHDFVMGKASEVCIIRGRINFCVNGQPIRDPKTGSPVGAPFPSIVVVYDSETFTGITRFTAMRAHD